MNLLWNEFRSGLMLGTTKKGIGPTYASKMNRLIYYFLTLNKKYLKTSWLTLQIWNSCGRLGFWWFWGKICSTIQEAFSRLQRSSTLKSFYPLFKEFLNHFNLVWRQSRCWHRGWIGALSSHCWKDQTLRNRDRLFPSQCCKYWKMSKLIMISCWLKFTLLFSWTLQNLFS